MTCTVPGPPEMTVIRLPLPRAFAAFAGTAIAGCSVLDLMLRRAARRQAGAAEAD